MSPSGPRQSLQLPRTGRSANRRVFRRRRVPRWRRLLAALALSALGAGLLVLLLQVPERFNTVLALSQALLNLITGARLLLIGLAQLLILLVLVAVALLALGLVITGVVRLIRSLSGAPERRGPTPPR